MSVTRCTGLNVDSQLIYSVFMGLTVFAACLTGRKKKVDISVRDVLSHSNKLNVNFIQFLQAFSSLSRDFLQCIFCSLPGSDFLKCVHVWNWKIRTSYHQLTRLSQTLCRHCLNGKDVDCAALFHPHIYFSPSESSHKERKASASEIVKLFPSR